MVLNAAHSELTALIGCWAIAFAVAEVELVRLRLESIGELFAVIPAAESLAIDALIRDARTVHLAERFDSMTCWACTDDKRLDKPLVCNSLIDMVANSTYHVDADHMRNTMADMWDSASDAAAVNNGSGSVTPAALATVAEVILEMKLAVADIEKCVKNLQNFNAID